MVGSGFRAPGISGKAIYHQRFESFNEFREMVIHKETIALWVRRTILSLMTRLNSINLLNLSRQ